MAGATDHNATTGQDASAVERLALQRKRSIAIAVSLGVLVALFYVATLVKMGGDAATTRTPAKAGAASEKAAKP